MKRSLLYIVGMLGIFVAQADAKPNIVWIISDDLGAINESKTVDIDALMKEKWDYYVKTMKRRGLDPNLPDRAYLQWWKKELGVE